MICFFSLRKAPSSMDALIFSMRFSIEIMLAGLVISALVYWFACKHMNYNGVTDYKAAARRILLSIPYLCIFVWEATKANVAVLKIVFAPKIKIKQQLIYFRTELRSNIARVTLANSITLAPGSVTVALDDGLYCVHFMDSRFWNGVDNFIFVRLLQNIEKHDMPVSS